MCCLYLSGNLIQMQVVPECRQHIRPAMRDALAQSERLIAIGVMLRGPGCTRFPLAP